MNFTTELDSTSYGGMLELDTMTCTSPDATMGLDLVPQGEELESLVRRFSAFLIRIDYLRKMASEAESRPESEAITSFRDHLTEMLEDTRSVREPMLQAILCEENPLLGSANYFTFDIRQPRTRSLDEIMVELMRFRWRQASLVTALPAADFARMGRHPFYGDVSLAGLIAIFVDQDEAHLRRLKMDHAQMGEMAD